MPGPIIKKSDAFKTGNSLIDTLLDQGDAASIAPVATVVTGPANLLKALKPLTEGSIDVGKKLAKDPTLQDALPFPPEWEWGSMPSVLRTLVRNMIKGPSSEETANKAMEKLTERATSKRPFGSNINIPEGFSLPKGMEMERSPLVEEMLDRYMKFDKTQANVPKLYKNDRPPISGRWVGSKIGNQARSLSNIYKKKE